MRTHHFECGHTNDIVGYDVVITVSVSGEILNLPRRVATVEGANKAADALALARAHRGRDWNAESAIPGRQYAVICRRYACKRVPGEICGDATGLPLKTQ